jgi:hypothetical protein
MPSPPPTPSRRPRRYRAWLLLALTTLQPACGAGWHRIDLHSPAHLPPRQQVQLWSQGQLHRWHAVQWSPDLVSGIPFLQPIDCDSCRLFLAQVAVDSVRLGNPTGAVWRSVGLTLGSMVLAAAVLCSIQRNCDFGE